jgi:hypothetical protein
VIVAINKQKNAAMGKQNFGLGLQLAILAIIILLPYQVGHLHSK